MFKRTKLTDYLLACLIPLLTCGALIYQNRLPVLHDTFQYLVNQFMFYNEVVQHKSVPFWIPFDMQGFVSNYIWTPQLTMLSSVYYFLALFFKNFSYLKLFYVSLCFEECFFVLGVFLLSAHYYKDSRVRLLVSMTLGGAAIWYPQIYWNFHFFYFIPMVLYLMHQYFDAPRFKTLSLMVCFFSLSIYGNFVYAVVFGSFVCCCYFVGLWLMRVLSKSKGAGVFSVFSRPSVLKKLAAFILLCLILFIGVYSIKFFNDQIMYLGGNRDASGEVTIETFLTYGGSVDWSKYLEIWTRFGESLDIDLYGGLFIIPFCLIALYGCRKKVSYLVLGVGLTVLLFSVGSFVSRVFYHAYPLGKVFRHIGLTATMFKCFMVFYAGFGCEVFLEKGGREKKYAIGAFIALVIGFFLYSKGLGFATYYFDHITNAERMLLKGVWIVSCVGSLLLLLFIIFDEKDSFKERGWVFVLLLSLVFADMFSYKYALIVARMPQATKEQIKLFTPFDYKFQIKRRARSVNYFYHDDRTKAFKPFVQPNVRNVTQYNTVDSLLYLDVFLSSFRSDYALKPIKEYFGLMNTHANNDAYLYMAGVGTEKIKVFSRLHVLASNDAVGSVFGNKQYRGHMLFSTMQDYRKGTHAQLEKQGLIQYHPKGYINMSDERVKFKAELKKFSFNELRLDVVVDGPPQQSAFFYYSDAFHPHWKAYVNGVRTQVIKANVGYKAIKIPRGSSHIILKFDHPFYTISIFAALFSNLLICLLTIYMFKTKIVEGED